MFKSTPFFSFFVNLLSKATQKTQGNLTFINFYFTIVFIIKKIFLSIFLCVYYFSFQDVNAGRNNSRTISTANKTKDEKKPFKRKDVFSFEDKKNIKTFKADSSKIKAQRELLIRDLRSSLIYLNNLFKTIQPIAKNYWGKADGNLIASELAVFAET